MALVPCYTCGCLREDFTMSVYRLVSGGPTVGRVCADCSQGVTAEELAKREKAELAEFANRELDTVVNAHPVFKVAEKQVCVCPRHVKNVVYIGSIDDVGGEFPDKLDGYYCVNCNSFWREP